ncbi:hypothetical protein PISMIDRAFT_687382 [Pisolithus microcarpus 441]|uniref:Uncharacterized protein n=1 Tax=Pisolithus microcarpus 441 TaxID=765257 RepID=A0A0C9YYM4_9AGAM|nr:hypothetical protein PISMIDRAFT_687382 [Pisolithus microcarpus 441]
MYSSVRRKAWCTLLIVQAHQHSNMNLGIYVATTARVRLRHLLAGGHEYRAVSSVPFIDAYASLD